ncbi:MAG: hypothetical protein LBC76_11785 [Treponema sp.]|nr:hypothetical protein [Treponema sp.]
MLRKTVIIITIIVFINVLLSCGIDEYYYLPQVPEINVTTDFNTNATVNFPKIPDDYYYAACYTIFYRIYVSSHSTQNSSPSEFNLISPYLNNDYNYLLQFTNPVNTSATTSTNTFKNRNFFKLEFEGTDNINMLPKNGGKLLIDFPTTVGDIPFASLNGERKYLLRSSELTSPEPSDDLYFRNTPELYNLEYATDKNKNADVAGRSGDNMNLTYVAMYIAAVGTNPNNFTTIYSKPTFISVFRLPNKNS